MLLGDEQTIQSGLCKEVFAKSKEDWFFVNEGKEQALSRRLIPIEDIPIDERETPLN